MRIILGSASLAFVLAWGVSSVSTADAAMASRVYLAFQAGITQHREDTEEFAEAIDDGSLSDQRFDDEERFRAAQLGIRLSENWAVELGYAHLGEYEYEAQSSGSVNYLPGPVEASVEIDGMTLGLAYTHPLSRKLDLTLKAGVIQYDDVKSLRAANGDDRRKIEDEEGFAAVGAAMKLSQNTAINLEYQYFGDDIGIDAVSLGFRFNF